MDDIGLSGTVTERPTAGGRLPDRLLRSAHGLGRLTVAATAAVVLLLGEATVLTVDWVDDSWWTFAPLTASVLASGAAVLTAPARPALAAGLAVAPFSWLLLDHRWLGVWLVAQLAVVAITAVRSWRLAVLPAVGGLVAVVLTTSQQTVILTGTNRSHQEAFGLTGNQSWAWQQLALVTAAAVLPAAIGVLLRADVSQRVLEAREEAVRRTGTVQSERARLAADLHDVVAHHISLIAVRAETAPYTTPGTGAASRQVLAEIAEDARRALDELRGVLGVLHRAEKGAMLAPQPGIRDLPELVLRSTRAGDRVVADGVDATWIVPDTVGYVVYRVVQESLTNARRHAHGGPVELRLDRDGAELVIEVANESGRSTAAAGSDGGAGLVNMAERVEALGGLLVAGPTADGGFHVTARVPVADGRR